MKRFVAPMIAMITLLVGVIVLGSLVPSTVTHPGYGGGCSCMNGGIALYVDDESALMSSLFYRRVESGSTFSVLISVEQQGGATSPTLTWKPDTEDNAKFKFDPQEVKDNSPNDRNPANGAITVQFKIAVPVEPGSYDTELSIPRGSVFITVIVEPKGAMTATVTKSASTVYTTATLTSMPIDTSPLTEREKYWLTFLREEEKLARDVYSKLGDKWDSKFLKDLVASEQTHMDHLKPLLDNHKVPDPVAGNGPGVFANSDLQKLYNQLIPQGSVSLVEALKVGKLIEEKDISDLKQGIATTNHEDVKAVYNNLLTGSTIHLNAFQVQLSKYSTTTSQETGVALPTLTIIAVVAAIAAVALVGAFYLRRKRK